MLFQTCIPSYVKHKTHLDILKNISIEDVLDPTDFDYIMYKNTIQNIFWDLQNKGSHTALGWHDGE